MLTVAQVMDAGGAGLFSSLLQHANTAAMHSY